MKAEILVAIGETELQPASSLAANDRVKYVFSLLQMALAHADHPDGNPATLKRERVASGGGGATAWQGVRGRLPGAHHRPEAPSVPYRRDGAERGRPYVAGRQ